jgi:two-component system chemotaxis sensor kinase CheA
VYRLQRQSSGVLNLLGRQLRHDVRQARTVPADGVFQGFRKMLRDVAHSEGKEIDFRTAGLDVRADRLVLQALKDPLMHALRNAVCHGIEPPDERRRLGKEPAGRVSLRLEVHGSRLHVVVEDDGRGVDSRAVTEQALRQGLLTEAEASAAGPAELNRLVFQPGFSTAREVTDLSGRGMGLSVVSEAATRLQGGVELIGLDPGTRLRITVPLSVTAQRLLLVSCGGQTFAVPAHGVERLCRARRDDVEVVGGQPMLLLGEPIRLQPLARLLGLGDEEQRDPLPVLVVRSGPRRLAVSVDEMIGVRDSLIKDLGPPASRDDRWAGGILLEDGSVCLVLNPASLFDPARPAPSAVAPVSRPTPKRVRTILVVDDSLTTRTLEKSILEAHGYRVVLALDGIEALAKMRESLPDLVISDVQMPRLDGFGLLEQMKKDPRLARLPVIIVTSLEKREDQERGLALGADAYVVKRKFDHEELLHTVQQIL